MLLFQALGQAYRNLLFKQNIIRPERIQEVFATSFILSSTTFTYSYGMFLVLPELFVNYPKTLLPLVRILASWVQFAVLANIYLVRKRKSSIASRTFPKRVVQSGSPETKPNPKDAVKELNKFTEEQFDRTPTEQIPQNWHICEACEVIVPPRTWHCLICRTCILRRDHHCIFTGCCIGEENQSNFMGLVFYLGVGTTVSTVFSWAYHIYVLDLTFWSFLFKTLVIIYTMFFNFDVNYLIAAISAVGHIAGWGAFTYYFYISMKGQTSADAHRNVYWTAPAGKGCYGMSFANMRSFLGPHPIHRILWPFHTPLKIDYEFIPTGSNSGIDDFPKQQGLCKSREGLQSPVTSSAPKNEFTHGNGDTNELTQ